MSILIVNRRSKIEDRRSPLRYCSWREFIVNWKYDLVTNVIYNGVHTCSFVDQRRHVVITLYLVYFIFRVKTQLSPNPWAIILILIHHLLHPVIQPPLTTLHPPHPSGLQPHPHLFFLYPHPIQLLQRSLPAVSLLKPRLYPARSLLPPPPPPVSVLLWPHPPPPSTPPSNPPLPRVYRERPSLA